MTDTRISRERNLPKREGIVISRDRASPEKGSPGTGTGRKNQGIDSGRDRRKDTASWIGLNQNYSKRPGFARITGDGISRGRAKASTGCIGRNAAKSDHTARLDVINLIK